MDTEYVCVHMYMCMHIYALCMPIICNICINISYIRLTYRICKELKYQRIKKTKNPLKYPQVSVIIEYKYSLYYIINIYIYKR